MSSLQILSANNLPEKERKEIVDCALECGKSMLRTLNDILTIAKSKNCIELVQSPMNLSKVCITTSRIMTPMAENKVYLLHSIYSVYKLIWV